MNPLLDNANSPLSPAITNSVDSETKKCVDMIGLSLEPHEMSAADAADMERILSKPLARTTTEAQPLP